LIIIIITASILFFGCSQDNEPNNKPEITELTFKTSFPVAGKQEWYLAIPVSMKIDDNNNFFICDVSQNKILHINQKGTLIKKFGRVGRGPGDLFNPIALYYKNDTIYVSEGIPHWIKWFDTKGNYINGFKVLYVAKSICMVNDKIYTSILPRDETGVTNMIFVYNKKGELINKFGEFLDFVPNLSNIISRSLLLNHNNKLYVLFAYYPVLRVYSPEGELLRELTLNKSEYRKKFPDRYKWENFKKRKDSIASSPSGLFSSYFIADNYIFIQLHNDNLIDQYDFSGNLVRRFIIPDVTEGYLHWDFQIVKENNYEYTFFIINADSKHLGNDAPHIDVYTAKLK